MRYLSRSRETGNKKREPRNEKQWRWAEQLRLSPPGNSIVRRRAGHAVSRSRADCGVGPARTCSRQTARTCGSRKCASALDVGTEYTSLRDGISVITAINAVLKSRLHCFCPRHLSLACRVSSHETALAHCPPTVISACSPASERQWLNRLAIAGLPPSSLDPLDTEA